MTDVTIAAVMRWEVRARFLVILGSNMFFENYCYDLLSLRVP
jgi:hypothetical protein